MKSIILSILLVLMAVSPVWAANPARQSAQTRGTESPSDGVWYVYDRKGYLAREEHYSAYRLQGEVKTFYPSGAIKESTIYFDNSRQGPSKTYYENGALQSDSFYANNNLEGGSNNYYDTGELESSSHYSNGNLNGEKRVYYKDGSLKQLLNYRGGVLSGSALSYGENGLVTREEVYDNGTLVARKENSSEVLASTSPEVPVKTTALPPQPPAPALTPAKK